MGFDGIVAFFQGAESWGVIRTVIMVCVSVILWLLRGYIWAMFKAYRRLVSRIGVIFDSIIDPLQSDRVYHRKELVEGLDRVRKDLIEKLAALEQYITSESCIPGKCDTMLEVRAQLEEARRTVEKLAIEDALGRVETTNMLQRVIDEQRRLNDALVGIIRTQIERTGR